MEISKPDYTYLWSSGGAIVAPSNVKVQTGWTAEVPPYQWENWSQNRQDQAIAHVLQHGISVWDTLTEYQAGKSYVQGSDGKLYVAVQTHTNQNPTGDVTETYWADASKPGMVVITSTTTWSVPAILKLGLKKADVTVIGGGGGGGSNANAGSGGGGGGVAIESIDLTGITTVSVTVGAGGAGATAGGGVPAQAGGTSSFGAYCSATGGEGAVNSSGQNRGAGGIGSGGIINDTLGPGYQRHDSGAGSQISGKGGGPGGGASIEGGVLTGSPATGFGCGGGGGTGAAAGGVGKQGLVVIKW